MNLEGSRGGSSSSSSSSGSSIEGGGMSSVSCGNGKLRQWLIEQIDSAKYPGLIWENEEKSIFRIPWKHAGKQDYNREEDAALFKAWALFKGKFREGIDKPDPPTWKTRLRCALNKSNDFEELVERSQLDISDPYKVYRIIPEGAKKAYSDKSGGVVQETTLYGACVHFREPVGVVGIACPDEHPLLSFVSLFAPAITRGNCIVIIPSERYPLPALDLIQVFDTSDVPAGVVNIISGSRDYLSRNLSEHHDVQAMWYFGSKEGSGLVEWASAGNLKRTWVNYGIDKHCWRDHEESGEEFLYHATQCKSVWMPMGSKQLSLEDPQMIMNNAFTLNSSYSALQPQVPNYMVPHDRNWREYIPDQSHPDLSYQCTSVSFPPRNHHWQGPSCQNGCQVTGSFYACAPPETQTSGIPIEGNIRSTEGLPLSDCRLHICLYYHETLVKEVTTSSPEGCRITHGHSYEISSMDQVMFPYPEDHNQRKTTEKLLSHLERGVILWLTHDGLYAKRLCQSRIYWDGPLAFCSDRPNKLEREQTCKLFDTQKFLSELQIFAHHGRPLPRFQIVLCFGEEFPDPQRQRKQVTAHVEPVFARQLYYFAQQNTGPFLRGYDISEQITTSEDYHRSIHHSSVQE